jgi:glycosyltransferase involved in cell wall biosynthesis
MPDQNPHNPLEGERPEMTINLHDGSEEQISIVVVHRDRPEYLNICLQSIAVTSFNNNYEIIVVDNGSDNDSQDFLDDIDGEVKVVKNDKNLYWSEACNIGYQNASKDSKYIVFMHCDVVVTNPAWLDLLVNVCESQNAGIVGVELQSYYMQQQKVDFVQEWLMMATRECWEAVGPWPEHLPQVGPAFIVTVKAQHKGYKPQIMRNPIAHHYRIFSLDINEYERLTESAMVTIPQLLKDAQSDSVKPIV